MVGIIVVILLNPQVFECGCDAVNGDVGGQRVVVGRMMRCADGGGMMGCSAM